MPLFLKIDFLNVLSKEYFFLEKPWRMKWDIFEKTSLSSTYSDYIRDFFYSHNQFCEAQGEVTWKHRSQTVQNRLLGFTTKWIKRNIKIALPALDSFSSFDQLNYRPASDHQKRIAVVNGKYKSLRTTE